MIRLTRSGILAALVAIVLAVAAPAVAFGGTASDSQYGTPTHSIQQQVASGKASGGAPSTDPQSGSGLNSSVGPLPFTGFDVLAMAAVALAVTGLGLGLQRAVARQREQD